MIGRNNGKRDTTSDCTTRSYTNTVVCTMMNRLKCDGVTESRDGCCRFSVDDNDKKDKDWTRLALLLVDDGGDGGGGGAKVSKPR